MSIYRRIFRGVVERGKTREFLATMRESVTYQVERGVRARTAIWGGMTGPTNGVIIAADFNALDDLERYTEMAANDQAFAAVRHAVRENMVYDGASVTIQRLSYHSEGLMSAEEATAPRNFMRTLSGEVLPGRHREFYVSIAESLEYQKARGIDATTSVWSALTGGTSEVVIAAEFDSLAELQKFDDMGFRDAEFGRLRRETRANMAFSTSHVELLRNMYPDDIVGEAG